MECSFTIEFVKTEFHCKLKFYKKIRNISFNTEYKFIYFPLNGKVSACQCKGKKGNRKFPPASIFASKILLKCDLYQVTNYECNFSFDFLNH